MMSSALEIRLLSRILKMNLALKHVEGLPKKTNFGQVPLKKSQNGRKGFNYFTLLELCTI